MKAVVSQLFVALFVGATLRSCAFPISSSSSSRRITNQKSSGPGGFGKGSEPMSIQYTPDTSESILQLLNFLDKQKAEGILSPSNCEIGHSTLHRRRGVFAKRDFKKNEIICKIPSDCALALSNPDLGGADAPTFAHCGRNLMDMYLNHPVASKTWKPYLDTLPTKTDGFDATPDFFTDEEIDALEFPRAINQARQRLQDIAEICAANDDIDFHELQFATWLVSSRCLSIAIENSNNDADVAPEGLVAKPNKSIRILIPFLDMVNHSSDNSNTEIHLIDPEKDEAWIALRTTRPIKAGKEITIQYGSGYESSVELLSNYGFVPNENKIDAVMVKKGGDGSIESLDNWSTSLDEDLESLEKSQLSDNMRKVLELRTQLKRSYSS